MTKAILTPAQTAMADKNDIILNWLIDHLRLKNDAALARIMDSAAPVISKMRYGKLPFGAVYQIRAHELTGLSIREIKDMIGEKSLARIVLD